MAKSKIAAFLVAGSLILSSLVGCNGTNPIPTPTSNNPESSVTPSIQGDPLVSSSNATPQPSSNVNPQPGSSNVNPQPGSSNVNPQPGSSINPTPSSQVPGPNSSIPAQSSQPAGNNWNSQQIAVMEGSLYGLVLPYFEGAMLNFMTEGSPIYISGFDVSETDFQNYVAKLVLEGWDMQDISALMNGPAKSVYMAQRAIETPNGTRYIVLTVACLDGDFQYATSGTLSLIAQNPYVYTYDDAVSMLLNILANAGFSNIDLIPEIPGVAYYSINEYDQEEEALSVAVYISSAQEDAGLTALLKGANWIVKDEKNAQGYYVAYPPQNGYILEYKYFANEGILELIFKPGVGWNELTIENFFKKYNKTPISFPKLEIEGATYKFSESDNNDTYASVGAYYAVEARMVVTHTSINDATVKNYVGELRKAGFVCNTYDRGESYTISKMIGEDELYYGVVSLIKNGQKPQFELTIRAGGHPDSGRKLNWPSQTIATTLGEAVNDTLPAYTGVNAGFKIENDNYAGYVLVYLDDASAETAVSSYETILRNNGYTLEKTLSNGENEFHSKNNEIYARAFIDASGVDYVLYICFKYIAPSVPTSWPSEDITKAIQQQLAQGSQITDTIPVFSVSDASDCYVATNFGGGEFEIRIEGIGASFIDTVKAGLTNANYIYDPFYQFDTNQVGVYLSPNGQMMIYVYVVNNDVMLAVKNYYGSFYQAWPNDIPLIIAGWGANNDTLPEFTYALYIEKLEKENKEMDVSIMTSDNNTAKALYEEILVKAGYKYDAELNGFKSRNNELLVGLSVSVVYFVISVKYIGEGGATPITTGQWPAEKLSALFGADFVIPKPSRTDISYSLSDENIQNNESMKMAMVVATVTDGSAEAIINEFAAYLTRQYGYTYDETTGTYAYAGQGMPNYIFNQIDANNFIIGIFVAVAPVNENPWPSEVVSSALTTWEAIDNIPTFEELTAYEFTYSDYYVENGELSIYAKGGDSALISAMDAKLKEAGYTSGKGDVDPETKTGVWLSKNKEIKITAWAYADRINITVQYVLAEWPSESIANFIEGWELENDIIPAFTSKGVKEYIGLTIFHEDNFHISVYPKADETITIWTLKDEYINILAEYGYTFIDEEFDYYYSENHEVEISFIPGVNYFEIVFYRVEPEIEEGTTYNSVLADFKAVTGIQLPEMEGLTVEDFPYEEGMSSYCLDITGGKNLSRDTFDTLLTFLNKTLRGWQKEVDDNDEYYTVNFTSTYGDFINLVWDKENQCVYLNAEMVTVISVSSFSEGKSALETYFGISLPNYTEAEIGENSFAKDGTEATFAFSYEEFTTATFNEVVAVFKRKLGNPVADLSYSEEGYLSETWIVNGKMYTVNWNPDSLTIDINIMPYEAD